MVKLVYSCFQFLPVYRLQEVRHPIVSYSLHSVIVISGSENHKSLWHFLFESLKDIPAMQLDVSEYKVVVVVFLQCAYYGVNACERSVNISLTIRFSLLALITSSSIMRILFIMITFYVYEFVCCVTMGRVTVYSPSTMLTEISSIPRSLWRS